MTKLTVPNSIEHGIRRVLAILGDDGVEHALETAASSPRSASLIRKCGDPDNARHHLQLRYAIALDAACRSKGHLPPLLRTYQHLLDETQSDPISPPVEDGTEILYAAAMLHSTLSGLFDIIVEEFPPRQQTDAQIRLRERTKICDAIESLQAQAETLKRLVGNDVRINNTRTPINW